MNLDFEVNIDKIERSESDLQSMKFQPVKNESLKYANLFSILGYGC